MLSTALAIFVRACGALSMGLVFSCNVTPQTSSHSPLTTGKSEGLPKSIGFDSRFMMRVQKEITDDSIVWFSATGILEWKEARLDLNYFDGATPCYSCAIGTVAFRPAYLIEYYPGMYFARWTRYDTDIPRNWRYLDVDILDEIEVNELPSVNYRAEQAVAGQALLHSGNGNGSP